MVTEESQEDKTTVSHNGSVGVKKGKRATNLDIN